MTRKAGKVTSLGGVRGGSWGATAATGRLAPHSPCSRLAPGAASRQAPPARPVGGCAARARTHSGLAPFPSEESAYDEYENDPGITAIALYDYQAGERGPGPGRAGLGRGGLALVSHVTRI